MPTVPREIKVVRRGAHFQIFIDGDEFPWHITEDGVAVETRIGQPPIISISILADRVEVLDEHWGAPSNEGDVR